MYLKTFLAASKMKLAVIGFTTIAIASAVVYTLVDKNSAKANNFNPAFKTYVSAYTGGYISKESPVLIRFFADVAKPEQINVPVEASLFDFDPDIKGTVTWLDKNTIQFKPNEPLPSDKAYEVSFKIGNVMEMPKELEKLDFNFQTMPQTFEVMTEGLGFYDVNNLALQKLAGTLITSDVAENNDIEKVLQASQNNKDLHISWTHDGDRKTHHFEVDGISRNTLTERVELEWNGEAIQSETAGKSTYEIPALGDFKIMSARAIQGEEQYAELQFSDPLDEGQSLEGLITINGIPDIRVITQQNVVKLYPPVRQIGEKTINVSEGIKNILGKRLTKNLTFQINFEELKPAVRLIGKGVILPDTEGLLFPFEAVSLKSVEVKVVKIFENNVAQFLQVNSLDGSRELIRVGKVVMKKSISLNNTNPSDFTRWKKYNLDLSALIQTEPGAIYQINIGFKKKDAYYSCDSASTEGEGQLTENEEEEEEAENDVSYWDSYEENYYPENYEYSNRENPCTNSYYGSFRSVNRNILASNLGIIAKRGTSGNMVFAVTDLRTTEPIEGAAVEIYDYQQQLIGKENTNQDGMVSVDLSKKPFLLIVKKGNQTGYLKMDDASALAISNFDVSGAKVQKGIKGFLYGERGVWRPGDSLYLTFILEDKLNKIPENQPVAFELSNPQGQVTKRIVSSTSINGFYNFSTNTNSEDPTGNWTASIKVGGASFSYPVRVETVMPNRLKILMNFEGQKITPSDNNISGNLDVKWLHGATARNLKADITMQLVKAETKFPKYPNFIFDDPGRDFNAETIEIFDGRTDENGHAHVNTRVDAEGKAPGILTANFRVKVMEEGGGFSTDRFSLPYYPYKSFVGIRLPEGDKARNMLLTDTNHVVDIVAVDPDGIPVSGRNVDVQVYKLEWRWWWDSNEEDNSAFLDNTSRQSILNETVTTINGKAKWRLRINHPEWGRYYVKATDRESGHSTGKIIYMDWPGWAGSSREKSQGASSLLSFSAHKAEYKVGEKVTLTIPGSANGRALVSIESGSKVIESHWVETISGKTEFSFDASEDMAPNVYVNVTLLQPHAQTVNDLPIRLYGIIPLKVDNPKTLLKPLISMKEELRPEEKVAITVSEATGKPMTYTIAVVDEGLLDLTRFSTPDPWKNFYAREALDVNTWDMYDYVIGASGMKMNKLLAIGGDGQLKGSEGNKANRFKPVVKFLGPFTLSGGSATHTFKMPEYVGSVRTMVIAGNQEGAYGNAQKTTPVRKPLMILATLPRVLGPDEYVALPVNVFAMTPNVRNVSVDIATNNRFEILEERRKEVSFAAPGDEVVNFYIKVKPGTGVGKVKINAVSGSEKASYDISIDVRNPNVPVVRTIDTIIQPGSVWNSDYTPFGTFGTNKGILEVSSIPPINLGKRLQYVVSYPYGCVEQTTSSVFPQLYVKELVESGDIVASRLETNIKAGIQRLKTFQLPEGGLGYWPGADDYDSWSTSYAGHFMLEAEKKGYALPQGFISNWKKHQAKVARNWSSNGANSDLNQAYRLYTLALANDPESGAMNRLRETKNLSVAAKWRLAGAYVLSGQTEAAQKIIANIPLSIPKYNEMDNTFGSDLRDKAMILEVLSMMNKKTEATPLVKEISVALSGQSWLSTQETAFCLLAISKYATTSLKASKLNFTYRLNGGKSINAVTDMKIAQVNANTHQTEQGSFDVKNNTAVPLYARLILSGTPEPGKEEAAENNLVLNVSYKDSEGNAVDPSSIEQGTNFIAEVSVMNPGRRGNYKAMALKQIFPSGWEILNSRMDGFEEKSKDIPTYVDIRDDRVYTFFDLAANATKKFRVQLNAAYLGKFYLPAVYSEAMYEGTINSTIPGKWVEVVKPGQKGI
ncbi:MAG TPA: MG2 domain-containing protein [Cytophagaceae bacterium]|jgi:hypothetical protein